MKILGIETSCDETAAAIVTDKKEILSNIVLSQTDKHKLYGGVVPELAARAHMDSLSKIIELALLEGKTSLDEIDAIAVTSGPGLIGGLIVGVMTAKGLASVTKKPFVAVNHLEGHALTARLTSDIEFPFLLLLVSGGHCQILAVEGVGKYKLMGETMDDALGEAFDKTAKMLGLGYPGGPIMEKMALTGDPKRFDFPRAMKGREGCDFSFSGIKTAIKQTVDKLENITEKDISDVAASFQACAGDILQDRISNAIKTFKKKYPDADKLVVAGGVAANKYLNGRLRDEAARHDFLLVAPPLKLCTDNAAMIAWAGLEKFKLGHKDGLDFEPRARWPLS